MPLFFNLSATVDFTMASKQIPKKDQEAEEQQQEVGTMKAGTLSRGS